MCGMSMRLDWLDKREHCRRNWNRADKSMIIKTRYILCFNLESIFIDSIVPSVMLPGVKKN